MDPYKEAPLAHNRDSGDLLDHYVPVFLDTSTE